MTPNLVEHFMVLSRFKDPFKMVLSGIGLLEKFLDQSTVSEYVQSQRAGQPLMVESMLVKAVDQCRAQSSEKLTLRASVSLVQVGCWMDAQSM